MSESKSVSSEDVAVPLFRLSFPQLAEAKPNQQGTLKFSDVMLFPPGTDFTELRRIVKEVVEEVKRRNGGELPANFRASPFRKAEEKAHLDGYEPGWIFAGASANVDYPPLLVDQQLNPIKPGDVRRELYAGCWCYGTVNAYSYDAKGNRGVSFGLRVVQKARDDSAFGGGGAAASLSLLNQVKDDGKPAPEGDDDDMFN